MKEKEHNKSFDELLRSKYQDEKVSPPKRLWNNIRQSLPGGAAPIKPWYLSKAVIIGASIAAAIGIVATILYFAYIKPHQKQIENNTTPAVSINSVDKIYHKKNIKSNLNVINSNISSKKIKPTNIKLNKATHTNIKQPLHSISKKHYTKKNQTFKPLIQKSIRNNQKVFSLPKKTKSFTILPPLVFHMTFNQSKPPIYSIIKNAKKKIKKNKQKHISKHHFIHSKKTKETRLVTHNNKKKKNIQKKTTTKKQHFSHRFSIEAFLMPEYSYRIVTANPGYQKNIFTPSYFNSRERYTFNYSFGLLVDYKLLKRLNIESGISYYIYSVNFSTGGGFVEKTGEHTGVVYTSSGTVDLDIEHSDSLDNNTLLKSFTKIEYLSVPVLFKFYPFKQLYINAGPTFDYYFNQTENWMKEDQEDNYNINSTQINGIRKFNVSFLVGLGYERRIWNNISLSVNPLIRIHLMDLNPSSTVKTYPYNAGFRVLLRYEF